MKLRVVLYVLLISSIATSDSYAQNARAMRRRDSKAFKRTDGEGNAWAAGITLGTPGIGLDVRRQISNNFNLRFGTTAFGYTYKRNFKINGGETDAHGEAKMAMNKVQVLAEWSPAPIIRFVGGIGLFYQQYIKAEGQLIDGINYGGINLKPSEAGDMTVKIDWNKLAPYVGIGLFRGIPKRRFNINLDLGIYYLGSPRSTWVTTGQLSQLDINEYKKMLDNYTKQYSILPVVQFGFNYKF